MPFCTNYESVHGWRLNASKDRAEKQLEQGERELEELQAGGRTGYRASFNVHNLNFFWWFSGTAAAAAGGGGGGWGRL